MLFNPSIAITLRMLQQNLFLCTTNTQAVHSVEAHTALKWKDAPLGRQHQLLGETFDLAHGTDSDWLPDARRKLEEDRATNQNDGKLTHTLGHLTFGE